jgi:5-methylcytosine-specific restriction endonuclease McrA
MSGYVVISRHGSRKNGEATWLCRCGCGTERIIRTSRMSPGKRCIRCTREAAARSSIDLTGRVFGSKTVTAKAGEDLWLAGCTCGSEAVYRTSTVRAVGTDHCMDCRPMARPRNGGYTKGKAGVDRTGQRYGHLIVLRQDETFRDCVRWLCRCDCGNVVSKSTNAFLKKGLRFCGAACPFWVRPSGKDHHRYRHGMSGTREYQSRYRGKRGGRRAGSLPRGYLTVLWGRQGGRCACCRTKIPRASERTGQVHLDHIVPIAAGGEHEQYNVQLLCSTCNVRKSFKDPLKWRQQHGYLL